MVVMQAKGRNPLHRLQQIATLAKPNPIHLSKSCPDLGFRMSFAGLHNLLIIRLQSGGSLRCVAPHSQAATGKTESQFFLAVSPNLSVN